MPKLIDLYDPGSPQVLNVTQDIFDSLIQQTGRFKPFVEGQPAFEVAPTPPPPVPVNTPVQDVLAPVPAASPFNQTETQPQT